MILIIKKTKNTKKNIILYLRIKNKLLNKFNFDINTIFKINELQKKNLFYAKNLSLI